MNSDPNLHPRPLKNHSSQHSSQKELLDTANMKTITIFASLLAAATLAFAAPTASSPVSGLKYDLITRDEILARLATSATDANDVLTKRTPGNVCSAPRL